ncbi:MAG: endolytic transglycosylase MltG [Pseudomonadota bacterium]|nr:endolytic transglycosylase MltG [Pseudomonadota bacterium]
MTRALSAFGILVAAVALLAGGVIMWSYKTFQGPGPLENKTAVVIKPGTGLRMIADQLEQAGILRYPILFIAEATWSGAHRDLKAGEYAFAARISPAAAMEKIRMGDVVIHRITIPEGLTSQQAAQLIDAAPALEGKLQSVPAEGSLLPETYEYTYGYTREDLVQRMKTARDATRRQLWQKRSKGLPLADPQAASTLASIVEKETADPEERPRIAAVFYNRLRRGMRLQSDPTVVYALTRGKGPLGRSLNRRDLTIKDPYNTYVIKGLPPGPIANPGTASLTAVLHPANTDDLYFVADGTGGHAFAKTLQAHNRNVARWRSLQRTLKFQSK